MKSLSRILILLLVFCIALTGVTFSAAPEDVQDKSLAKKLQVLSSLGILYDISSGGNFRPDDIVTRGEMALYMTQLLGLSAEEYAGQESIFTDVTEETEHRAAIQAATAQKIISGYPDGTFRPENAILTEEMIKVLICALGYQQLAELAGNYPLGYLTQAAEIRLLKGVDCSAGEKLSRGKLAGLLYNALHIPLLMANGFNQDGAHLEANEDRTILTEKLDCVYGMGLVTATPYTSLYGGQAQRDGYIKIENTVFSTGVTEAASMVGMYVDFYAREIDDEYTLLGIWPDESRLLTIDAKDIVKESTDFKGITVETENRKKQETHRFNDTPILIHNGASVPFSDAELIAPDLGTVVLSDTDDDGVYDVLIVTSYEIYIVDRVSAEYIFYKDDKGMIDLENLQIPAKIMKNHAPSDLSSLAQWDVVHVAMPTVSTHGICLIHAIDGKAGGVLNAISEDSAEIGDTSYEIAQEYQSTKLNSSILGQNVIGLLDLSGRLVDVQKLAVSDVGGYLFKIGLLPGLDPKVQFEFFTENSEWVSAKGADNIQVDGVSMDPEEVVDRFQCLGDADGIKVDGEGNRVDIFNRYINYEEGDPTKPLQQVTVGVPGSQPFRQITDRQLVLFRLNNDGEVMSIKTPGGENTEDAFVMRGDYTKGAGLQWRGGAAKALFTIDQSSPYAVAYGDEDTLVFQLPLNDPENKDAYSIKVAYNYPDNDITLFCKIYGYADDESIDSAAYIVTSASDEASRTQPMVIEKITQSLDADGEVVYTVYGYAAGAYVSYQCKKESSLRKTDGELLEFGDFAELETYSDDTIKGIYNYYNNDIILNVNQSKEENMQRAGAYGGYRDQSQAITGVLTDVSMDKRRITLDNGRKTVDGLDPSIGMWRYWTTTWIYIVDMKSDTIRVADLSELVIGDFISVKLHLSSAAAFVVYRNFE